jgi:hypothetical protein
LEALIWTCYKKHGLSNTIWEVAFDGACYLMHAKSKYIKGVVGGV